MKVNNQKTKNRFISMLGAVCVFVSCTIFPVLGAGVDGNEFFDPKDYAYIDFVEDHTVTYDVTVPDNWYKTGVFEAPEWSRVLGHYSGSKFSFETVDWGISLLMHPLGDNASVGLFPGHQIKNAHIIDITYIPKNTWFQSGYRIGIDGNGLVDNGTGDSVILYFVDENGVVVHRHEVITNQQLQTNSSGEAYIWYSYHANMADMNIPDSAVGFVPIYCVKNLTVGTEKTVTVEYSPFTFWFSMSALEWEAQENAKLQSSMDDIKAQQEELINGTPEQNQQVDNAVGALNNSGDKLNDLGDTMSSVEKPTIDSKKFSAGSLVPETSLTVLSAPFQALWENQTLLAMLTIVVALVLVSWVFFGKKG